MLNHWAYSLKSMLNSCIRIRISEVDLDPELATYINGDLDGNAGFFWVLKHASSLE
jgi:hypothetical protein